jgi:hypothetical protein
MFITTKYLTTCECNRSYIHKYMQFCLRVKKWMRQILDKRLIRYGLVLDTKIKADEVTRPLCVYVMAGCGGL